MRFPVRRREEDRSMKRIATMVLAVTGLLAGAGVGRGDEPKVDGKTLKDDDAGVRGSAAFTLGKVGADGKTVLGPLLEALDDEEASVRSNVLLTVAGLGRDAREAAPTLIKSLQDPNAGVRSGAAFALGKVGADG